MEMLSERIPRSLSEQSVDPDLSGLQGSSMASPQMPTFKDFPGGMAQ